MNTITNTIGLSRLFAVPDPVVAKPSSIITAQPLVSIVEETVSRRRCGVTRLGDEPSSSMVVLKRVLLLYGRFTVSVIRFIYVFWIEVVFIIIY